MIEKIPERIAKNQFLVLTLSSIVFIIFCLVYNTSYIIYGFITFIYFYFTFFINIFFNKVVYKKKTENTKKYTDNKNNKYLEFIDGRWLEFIILFFLTIVWLWALFGIQQK